MERSSASVGSGISRCRSGCPPVVGGGSILKWVPSARRLHEAHLVGIFSGQQGGNLALGVL